MLVQSTESDRLALGTSADAIISGIGRVGVRLANRSARGLHFEFSHLEPAPRAALDAKLSAIRAENSQFIEHATEAAAKMSAAFESAVSTGEITFEALFDNDYVPIEGSDPIQYRTRFLDLMESILPPIQAPLLARDKRMVLCVAIDRNGYIPVHRSLHSKPQRPDDPAWNAVNSRNRRLYDDPHRLGAARNTRPYLIQQYMRDYGNGKQILRTVAAPIRVFGKHWGAARTSYELFLDAPEITGTSRP